MFGCEWKSGDKSSHFVNIFIPYYFINFSVKSPLCLSLNYPKLGMVGEMECICNGVSLFNLQPILILLEPETGTNYIQ